jgi:phytoene dehydrogenase-like protein
MGITCDLLVIGAGHNGLAAAIHASRSGLSVIVLEASGGVGGAAVTVEPLLAGFRHHPHAKVLVHADIMPLAADLGLLDSAVTHWPDAQLGIAFSDGRPPVILHRLDRLARTASNLARYSRTDAETWRELKRRSASMDAYIRKLMYAPPNPETFGDHAAAVSCVYGDICDPTILGRRSARAIIDELFRKPEIRQLFYHLAQECGLALNEQGGDLAFLSIAVWTAGRWRVPTGGMQAVSERLRQTAVASSARILVDMPVKKVVLQNGRAVGVEVANGSIISAERAILSATPITTLFGEFLEPSVTSSREQHEIDRFMQQSGGSIATSLLCLRNRPQYKSARHDADIDTCLKTIVGHDTPQDVIDEDSEICTGLLPRPAGVVHIGTFWDASQAPPGHHVAAFDSRFPGVESLEDDQWREVEASFPDALAKRWAEYAPNMRDAVLDSACDARSRFERRMLLRTGDGQYRTSVPGLYMCGPGVFPGGGVNGASGYNAIEVIQRDLDIARMLRV